MSCDLSHIEVIREACRDVGSPETAMLHDVELDAVIVSVIVAQVRAGWKLCPPGVPMRVELPAQDELTLKVA